MIVEPFERLRRVTVGVARGNGDFHEPLGQLAAQLLVPLRARELHHIRRALDPRGRRSTNPHVLIGGGELEDRGRVLRIVWNLRDRGSAHRRVRMFPSRLGLESVEEGH